MAMSTRTGPSTELRTGQEDVGCQQTAHAVIATSSASAAVHLSDQPSAAAQSARTGYPASTAAAALGTAPFQHSPQTSLSASPSRGNVSNPRSSTNRGHSNWGQADDVALQRCVRGYGVQNWSRAMAAFRKLYKGPALSDRLLLGRYNKLQADAQRRRKQAHASRLLRSSASHIRSPRASPPLVPAQGAMGPRHSLTQHDLQGSHSSPSSGPSVQDGGYELEHEEDRDLTRANCSINATAGQVHLPQSSGGAAAGEPTLQGIGRAGSKWSAYEDDVLRRCVQLHGGCWPLILSEFRKAIPGHTRTKDSLVNRKQAVFAPGRTAQRLQSNSQTTGSSSLYHATSVRLSTSSVAAAPRSEAPSPQASDPVAVAEHAWTEGEKACLLQIALDHPDLCVVEQSEHSSQTDEVQRVYDIFRTIFPDTTRPPSSVHAKCCELLQRQQEAAEHRAGEEPMGEAPVGTQERYGGESVGQGDSYRSSASEGHSAPNEVAAVTSGQQADQEEPAAPSQPGEGEDNEMSGLHNTATGLASLAQQRDIPPTASPPSTNIAHAQPSGVTQLKTGVHDLECGFRFDYMLANLTICIHSAGYWEPIQPALQQLAPGSPQERAIFVFSILQDGSLLTLRTPPGTRSHAVCVDENGNEVDRQSRMSGQVKVAGIEHRFCSPDSLTVIFFEPL